MKLVFKTILVSLLLSTIPITKESIGISFNHRETQLNTIPTLEENGDIPFFVSLVSSEYQIFNENNINIIFHRESRKSISIQFEPLLDTGPFYSSTRCFSKFNEKESS